MVDAEVSRLRRLRDVALRTRALGKSLDIDSSVDSAVFASGTIMSWTIARIVTGRLRAHPYVSYQQDRGEISALAADAIAAVIAAVARRQNRGLSAYAEQVAALAREVDDVRALTWSPDLSDALGRMQARMRRLMSELECALPALGAVTPRARVTSALSAATRDSRDSLVVEESWPYLAI